MTTWKSFLTPGGRRRDPNGLKLTTDVIKEPPMEIVGQVLTSDEFVRYVEDLNFPAPVPTRIFLHHTWRPTPASWRGMESLLAMKAYYEKQRWLDEEGRVHEGWNAGPHLFVADDGIWLFSDLRWDGVGVYGHNYRSRHLEMVGDYDKEPPSGATLYNTVVALGILHARLRLDPQQLAFHRDFSSKSCPGWAVRKEWIIPRVQAWIAEYRRSKLEGLTELRNALMRLVDESLLPTNPDAPLNKASLARGLLGAISNEIPMEVNDRAYIVQLFAEALIVPAGDAGEGGVLTLREFELEQVRRLAEERRVLPKKPGDDLGLSPKDPFPFDGVR